MARPRHMDKRRGYGKLYLLAGFTGIILLFAWHNSAYLLAWGKTSRAETDRAARQRQSLEASSFSQVDVDGVLSGASRQAGDGADSSIDTEAAPDWGEQPGKADAEEEEVEESQPTGSREEAAADEEGAEGLEAPTDATYLAVERPAQDTAATGGGGSSSSQSSSNPAEEDAASEQRKQKLQQKQRKARPPAESPPQANAKVSRILASAPQPTLVLYVYYGSDWEHEERLGYFVRAAIREGDGATYKIIIVQPPAKKDSLPMLPPNAEYLYPAGLTCNSSWGAIAAVLPQLHVEEYEYVVTADSLVMGPFVPTYIAPVLHWTEVLTRKLSKDTKMVGSFISCEGTPKGGDVAGKWRHNPYVMPHTWATDKAGWALLAADPSIFMCYQDYWDMRYYGEQGASQAVLNAGYNLDSLLLRYQGVDWRDKDNWECNAKVRPDIVGLNDGIMADSYEVMFLPLSRAEAQHRLMLRTVVRYSEWTAPESGVVDLSCNRYRYQEVLEDWGVRGRKVLPLLQRWSCFDQEYYLEKNPDLADLAMPTNEEDAVGLWEHFLILGQFQAREHRFVCGEPELSKEEGMKLMVQRGRACFNHTQYQQQYTDLAGMTSPTELWMHYVKHGQFEGRKTKFICPETMAGRVVRGLDGSTTAELEEELVQLMKEVAEEVALQASSSR